MNTRRFAQKDHFPQWQHFVLITFVVALAHLGISCSRSPSTIQFREGIRIVRANFAQREYSDVISEGKFLLDSLRAAIILPSEPLSELYCLMGISYLEMQQYDSANAYLNLAIDEYDKNPTRGEDRLTMIRTLASSYSRQGNYKLATAMLRATLNIMYIYSDSPEVRRSVVVDLAFLYFQAKLYDSSAAVLKLEMSSWWDQKQELIPKAYDVVEMLIVSYKALEDYNSEHDLIASQIEIHNQAKHRDYRKLASLHSWLSSSLMELHKDEEAYTAARTGLALLDSGGISDRKISSTLYGRLADIESFKKRYEISAAHYDTALMILSRGLERDSARIRSLRSERDSTLAKAGR